MKRLVVVLMAGLTLGTQVHADESSAVTAKSALERLKTMAGTWEGQTGGEAGTVVFRVTGGGTAVSETMFPGSPHEMMSVYFVEGDDLVLTHYCAMGNQPKMKLDLSASKPEELRFVFAGGTNVHAGKPHVHEGRIVFKGDQYDAAWAPFVDDKAQGLNTFYGMKRKK